ncbi:MAG: hypothetical protein Q9208_000175 [Pyrenodesmia sp. 3 TL-2023]
MARDSPFTLQFLISHMIEHLSQYTITLPWSWKQDDESHTETEAKHIIMDDFIERINDAEFPSGFDLSYFTRDIVEMLVYIVWFEHYQNPAVRARELEIETELLEKKLRDEKGKRPGIFSRADPAKKPRNKGTTPGYSPEVVLDHLLKVLREKDDERYGPMLNDPNFNVRSFLLANLSPQLRDMFRDGIPTDHESLATLPNDFESEGPAIYLHAIGRYRYVGQANDLRKRVRRQHTSKAFRLGNPSLHYDVWEKLPDEEDRWVVLAYLQFADVKVEYRNLLLNITEMLGALLFQSLPAAGMDIFLDPSIERNGDILGLNIALPIDQGHADVEGGGAASIHHLRDSTDPLKQEYYQAAVKRAAALAKQTTHAKIHQNLINGFQRVLIPESTSRSPVMRSIHVRNVTVHVYNRHLEMLGIQWGDTVTIRCEVTPKPEHHVEFYAKGARPTDDARRLAIKMVSEINNTCVYMHAGGDITAFQANSLVDELEGVKEDESRAKGRRWFRTFKSSAEARALKEKKNLAVTDPQ